MRRGSHAGPVYEPLPCLCDAVRLAVESCSHLSHIDPGRVYCVASRGSRSRAYARIHGLSRAWAAVGVGPAYLIEVIVERFSALGPRGRLEVLLHELMHIPSTFSGALRPHGPWHSRGRLRRLATCLERSGAARKLEEILEDCPPGGRG